MIDSLTIQNFQSHKETKLEFDKGINIIIGQSDSGKSAVLRALNWVINNKPSGEAFRSNWGGDTEVGLKIQIHDDFFQKMVRKKTDSKNTYSIVDPNGVTGFSSFGQDVPEEIKQILNFSPLNMSGQFDSPFLLDMSGGEVARYLNKIVHLDVIDKSLSNIGRVLTKERADLVYANKEHASAKIKEEEFNWLDEAEGKLVTLEGLQASINEQKKFNKELLFHLNGMEVLEERLGELPDLDKYEDKIDKLIREQEEIVVQKQAMNRLSEMIENILVKEGQIRTIEKNLGSWEYQFEATMPEQCPLCGRGD
jgi:DNA repair protein SbcC/Rad50